MPDKKKIENYIASIASNYAKRWMEGNVYDRALSSDIGERLKSLDRSAKYGIEAGLSVLSAFFDQELKGDGALKNLVRGIGADVGPEISKRLLNHVHSSDERATVQALLSLEPDELRRLLDWLYDSPEQGRDKLLGEIKKLSDAQLSRLASLSAQDRKRVFNIHGEKQSPPRPKSAADSLADFVEMLGARLTESRKRRKEKNDEPDPFE